MRYITNRRGYHSPLESWINECCPDSIVREINSLDNKFIPPSSKEFTIYYTGENDHSNYRNRDFEPYCDDYPVNMRVGFDYDGHENYIRIPLWVFYINKQSIDYYHESDRFMTYSLVASHSGKRVRSKIVKAFENRNIQIDCLGNYRHNNDYMWNDCNNNKLQAISHSIFNICVENSNYPGYQTEKIFEALLAGCIPIYWGNNSKVESCINNYKVILIDPDNPGSTIDFIQNLLKPKNADELQRLQDVNPFTRDIFKVVDEYKHNFQNKFLELYTKWKNSQR